VNDAFAGFDVFRILSSPEIISPNDAFAGFDVFDFSAREK
jgi:hypothetical protein